MHDALCMMPAASGTGGTRGSGNQPGKAPGDTPSGQRLAGIAAETPATRPGLAGGQAAKKASRHYSGASDRLTAEYTALPAMRKRSTTGGQAEAWTPRPAPGTLDAGRGGNASLFYGGLKP